MKRVGGLLAAATLLLGLGLVPAAAQTSGTSIREVDLTDFPMVNLVVSTGDVDAEPGDLTVREGDLTVSDVTVAPLGEDDAVDVVLVLDTSGSMEGEPLSSAIEAASTFVRRLPAEIEVAVLTFSDRPQVAQRFTDDRQDLLAAIKGVEATGETALYDAVVAGSRLFSRDAQRNMIVLSDGGDTSSSASFKAATKAAGGSGAAVFTVGLESGEFDPAVLRSLGRINGGSYSTADTADLSSIYEGLAAGLSNQFLVSFSSAADPGNRISLTVEGPGGTDSVLVLAPKAKAAPEAPAEAPAPRPAPVADPVISGSVGLAVVILLVFGAVFLLMFAVGGNASEVQRDRKLARRFGGSDSDVDPESERSAWLPDSIVDAGARLAATTRLGATLEQKLERAGTPLKAGEFIAASVLAVPAGATAGRLLFSSFIVAAAFGLIAGSFPYLLVAAKLSRRQSKIQAQLADVLSVLASSLRAGHSFLQSLNMVAKQIPEPAAGEFARVVAEVRLGRPIDDALDALAERIGSADFRWAVMAVNIQREAGGNLAEVFDTVATTLRERDVLRRQVDVLSAEGRMSMIILTALPLGLGLYLLMVNPDYLSLLWTTRTGLVMLAVAGSLLALGQIWMKRVVKIDV